MHQAEVQFVMRLCIAHTCTARLGWLILSVRFSRRASRKAFLRFYAPTRFWRIGEAANPGPPAHRSLTVAAANVSSLSARYASVCALPDDLLLLTEVRCDEALQRGFAAELRTTRHVLWGKAMPRLPVVGVQPGGVAILVNVRLPRPRPLSLSVALQPCVAAGRVTAALIFLGSGKHPIAVYCAYGDPGGRTSTRDVVGSAAAAHARNGVMFRAILEDAAMRGDMPVLVGGDFNERPGHFNAFDSAMRTGEWFDLAGSDDTPTCVANDSSDGTRIDLLVANRAMRAMCSQYAVVLSSTLRTHRPVRVSVDPGFAEHVATRLRIPS